MVGSLARLRSRDIGRTAREAARGVRRRAAAINRGTVPYVGSRLVDFVLRLPSFVRGGLLQALATYRRPATFAHRGGPAVMLIPGLFCTPGVMNRLGRELERAGLDVYLPRAFPYFRGALANTGPVDRSVEILLDDLEVLATEHDVRSIALVGHSVGGIVALAATARAGDGRRELPAIDGVVLLSPPLDGTPLAVPLGAVFPACRDVSPDSDVLRLVRAAMPSILQVLSAGSDSFVPVESQEGLAVPTQRFADFQHMDFFVGSGEQVGRAGRAVAAAVHEASTARRRAARESRAVG